MPASTRPTPEEVSSHDHGNCELCDQLEAESESRRKTLLDIRAQQVEDWKRAEIAEAALAAQAQRDAEEIARLTAWVHDLQAGMYINCVYCGHRYGPDDEVPATMADALKEHVEQCPAHPMSALKAEIARLREELGRRPKPMSSADAGGGEMNKPEGWTSEIDPDLQIGDGVYVTFTNHSRDAYPDAPRPTGGWLTHKTADGWCTGAFSWWRPAGSENRPTWTLETLDPLTLSPSFRCHCGFHGFIKNGRWVQA